MFSRYAGSQVLQDAGARRTYHEFTEGDDRTALESLRTLCQQKHCGSTSPQVQLLLKVSALRHKQMPGDKKGKTGEN